jgi:23S rRNA (cytidine1920-2'-O)/16S rRNA (cytidine1409-2'-O)-methyltransferase
VLIKPQFEVGRGEVGKGGVVRDPSAWRGALEKVVAAGANEGLALAGACASPLTGPAGNHEFFVHLRRDVESNPGAVDGAIEEARG